ncbi:sodium:solute symporter family protein [Methanococcus voltae]|uniref:SSS sodium solute transporter superfamily n=1 Tax=Methanococcus voltae (strain ATCC BAA-1334 / A3) TaxID=456320 RepID=D7DS79_METV3|nr:sodium:solute symporter family protein [Methanococcus voltae]MCS3901515.1 SSS family solute:Na+ symporter [Methanococcus voltae]
MDNLIIWITISGYLLLMLFVSLYAKRFIKNSTDFLLAGRNLGIFLTTATLAATHYGGGFILGGAEHGVLSGLGGVWYGFACGLGLLLLGLFLAKPMRALALFTVPEVLEMRYNSRNIRYLSAFLSLTALIGIIGALINGASSVFQVLGIDPLLGAIISTFIFIAYTAASGLWAVALTDFIQVIIGSVGVILATALAFMKVGGMSGISTGLQALQKTNVLPIPADQYFNFGSAGIGTIALILAGTTMYTLIGQDFYQRLFASKNENVAKKGAIISGILLMILSFLPALAGMAALVLSNDPAAIIASPRTAVPELMITVFGSGVGALFLAAILAAVMSTSDSLLTASTSHIVKDFYQTNNPNVSDKKILNLSIWSTIIVGIFALVISLNFDSILTLMVYSYDVYTSGVFIPLVLGLVWKRATKEGALAGMVIGSLVSAGLIWGLELNLFTGLVSGAWEAIYASSALVSLVVMVIVSLMTKPQPINEKLKEAFPKIQ